MSLPEELQPYESIINNRPNLKLICGKIHHCSPRDIMDFENWMNGKKNTEETQAVAAIILKLLKGSVDTKPQPTSSANVPRPPQPSRGGYGGGARGGYGGGAQETTDNSTASSPDVWGEPFTNPYTFIPFPTEAPERHEPTPLSIDESDHARLTGVIDVSLKTLSPLLSSEDREDRGKDRNRGEVRKARRLGDHLIMPASSLRGCLRSLTGIISGSALDYIDDNLWLCQGRDCHLGGVGKKLYLAEVLKPGNSFHDGVVRFGEARLVKDTALGIDQRWYERKEYATGEKKMWIDDPGSDHPQRSPVEDKEKYPWRVKISGRPVGHVDEHQDGAFRPSVAKEITLRRELWQDYQGRNRQGARSELKKGDLIWLEPYPLNENEDKPIEDGGDVKSIQWARWGRTGVNFKEKIEKLLAHMLPDYLQNDGKVDITSDLFGSVPVSSSAYAAFAARVRCDNLVFAAGTKIFRNEMPPLAAPHPGCLAFYMDNDDYDRISLQDLPRGYKVYRTTKERGDQAPWKWQQQPIWDNGIPKNFNDCLSQTQACELIEEGAEGCFRLAYRGLSRREFALLLLVLSCDLRLGGGKPLGLGHCVVTKIVCHDETGKEFLDYEPASRACLPDDFGPDLPQGAMSRAYFYCQTQKPVNHLRYPRAVKGNQKGGMCWFTQFAAPKKNTHAGLESKWIDFNPRNPKLRGLKQVKAQGLPKFDPKDPARDNLFGYDIGFETTGKNTQQRITDFGVNHGLARPDHPRYPNESPNRQTRQQGRDNR